MRRRGRRRRAAEAAGRIDDMGVGRDDVGCRIEDVGSYAQLAHGIS